VLGADDLLETLGWTRPVVPSAEEASVAARLAAATRAELGMG
jgi:hypothetical protein